MAKKLAKKASKKAAMKQPSFTLKGDDLEMVCHALAFLADISNDMLNDTGLTPEERGFAGLDEQHCRDLLKRMEDEGA